MFDYALSVFQTTELSQPLLASIPKSIKRNEDLSTTVSMKRVVHSEQSDSVPQSNKTARHCPTNGVHLANAYIP